MTLPADVRSRLAIFAALVAMLLLIVAQRLHTYHEPLEPDIVTYATIGHEIRAGEQLYRDIWDVKPPGLYLTYAIADWVGGSGANAVFLLNVVFASLTLLALYVAGAALGPLYGVMAAALWVPLNASLVLQANQPNTEVFINAFCTGAFAVLVRARFDGARGWLASVLIGALVFVASTYKQVPAFLFVSLALAHLWLPAPDTTRLRRFAQVVVMGVTAAGAWLGVFLIAAAAGQFELYWQTIVGANSGTSAQILFSIYRYLREGKVLPSSMLFLLPLHIATLAAVVLGLRTAKPSRPFALLLAFVIGSHVMLFSQGGAFHPHSYQLLLPPLCLGVAWLAFNLAHVLSRDYHRLVWVPGAACLLVVIAHEVPNYTLTADEWSAKKYGQSVPEQRNLAQRVGALMEPEENVFYFGDGAALYYYTGRRPSTLSLWSSHLFKETALSKLLTPRVLEQLNEKPPELVVIDFREAMSAPQEVGGLAHRLLTGGATQVAQRAWTEHEIYAWIRERYVALPFALPETSKHVTVHVLRGSAAQHRLQDSVALNTPL